MKAFWRKISKTVANSLKLKKLSLVGPRLARLISSSCCSLRGLVVSRAETGSTTNHRTVPLRAKFSSMGPAEEPNNLEEIDSDSSHALYRNDECIPTGHNREKLTDIQGTDSKNEAPEKVSSWVPDKTTEDKQLNEFRAGQFPVNEISFSDKFSCNTDNGHYHCGKGAFSSVDPSFQERSLRQSCFAHLAKGLDDWLFRLMTRTHLPVYGVLSENPYFEPDAESMGDDIPLSHRAFGRPVPVPVVGAEIALQYFGRVVSYRLVGWLGPRLVEVMIDNQIFSSWIREQAEDVYKLIFAHLESRVGPRLKEAAIESVRSHIPSHQLEEMDFETQLYDFSHLAILCKAVSDFCPVSIIRKILGLEGRRLEIFIKDLMLRQQVSNWEDREELAAIVEQSVEVAQLAEQFDKHWKEPPKFEKSTE